MGLLIPKLALRPILEYIVLQSFASADLRPLAQVTPSFFFPAESPPLGTEIGYFAFAG
jgi:hypothetical protein